MTYPITGLWSHAYLRLFCRILFVTAATAPAAAAPAAPLPPSRPFSSSPKFHGCYPPPRHCIGVFPSGHAESRGCCSPRRCIHQLQRCYRPRPLHRTLRRRSSLTRQIFRPPPPRRRRRSALDVRKGQDHANNHAYRRLCIRAAHRELFRQRGQQLAVRRVHDCVSPVRYVWPPLHSAFSLPSGPHF